MAEKNWNSINDVDRCGGYTLLLTIVLLLVVSNLIATVWQLVKSEREESFRRYKRDQSELNVESGINYALNQIKICNRPWRTNGLWHEAVDRDVSYVLKHTQNGAYGMLQVYSGDSSFVSTVRTGFRMLSGPAVCVLDKKASVSLAKGAVVQGGIAVYSGDVGYSSHYKMSADKNTTVDTVFSKLDYPCFDSLIFFPEYSRNQFRLKFDNEYCSFDARDEIPKNLNCKMVVIQGNAFCEDCRINADDVEIRGNVSLKNVHIVSRKIDISEKPILGGMFFAQESLSVNLENKQREELKLIVQGKKRENVDYIGALNVVKLNAEKVLILFVGDEWDDSMENIPVKLSKDVDVSGLLFSMGTVDLQGKIQGQVVSWNFGFVENGLKWKNMIRSALIKRDTTIKFLLPDVIHIAGDVACEKL